MYVCMYVCISTKGNRIQQQLDSAKDFIENRISFNTYVMIIAFESRARVLQAFIKVTSHADRDTLIRKLPKIAKGFTCIGCGIKLALQELQVIVQ